MRHARRKRFVIGAVAAVNSDITDPIPEAPIGTRPARMKLIIDKTPDGTRSPNIADAVMMAFWPAMRAFVPYSEWVLRLAGCWARRDPRSTGRSLAALSSCCLLPRATAAVLQRSTSLVFFERRFGAIRPPLQPLEEDALEEPEKSV